MAWRDTLFVWRGELKLTDSDSKSQGQGQGQGQGLFTWKGTWVGVDSADARCAPSPSGPSFRRSEMRFDVGGVVLRKQPPEISEEDLEGWSGCELKFDNSFPGWLLDNGDGPELFQVSA